MGMVGGRAVWAAQVVTFDMSGSGAVNGVGGGTCGEARELARWNDTAGPAGVGVPMDGLS